VSIESTQRVARGSSYHPRYLRDLPHQAVEQNKERKREEVGCTLRFAEVCERFGDILVQMLMLHRRVEAQEVVHLTSSYDESNTNSKTFEHAFWHEQ
jgi:hypothetical protein